MEYLLTILLEFVKEDAERLAHFRGALESEEIPFSSLTGLMNNKSDYVCTQSLALLSLIVSNKHVAIQHRVEVVQTLATALTPHSDRTAETSLPSLVSSCKNVLQADDCRGAFVGAGGHAALAAQLEKWPQAHQLTYNIMLCLWLISFNEEGKLAFHKGPALRGLLTCVQTHPKEKVLRVGLATLRNLSADQALGEQMSIHGLAKTVSVYSLRHWDDEDVDEDLGVLDACMKKCDQILSTWDVYEKDLFSGSLTWSSVHKNEVFWKENCRQFVEKDFELLRVLIALIKESEKKIVEVSSTTLAVACFDLGQFAVFYPNGKSIVKDLGGKVAVMQRLQHPDATVQREALVCLQKLMVTNWEFMKR